MRDLLSWSIPLFRAFGIQVRLHILYIVITLGMLLRYSTRGEGRDVWEYALIWIVILFVIVLLHEFGHCFAARREGGDAEEILMWPLGGLAFCSVPHSAKANFITAAGGPLVNVLICLACATLLIPLGKVFPPLNPLDAGQLWSPRLHHYPDGATWSRPHDLLVLKAGTNEPIDRSAHFVTLKDGSVAAIFDGKGEFVPVTIVELAGYPDWVLWTARVFWMSWVLFLFNLLPAYPLDGGRLLQCLIWGRTGDFRRGTIVAVYAGFVVAITFFVVSFWHEEPMLLFMAIFIWYCCQQQYVALEMAEHESVFGYDFSQGYTSLEKDEPAAPSPKRPGPVARWRQARRERKAQREAEQRAADEARMDQLLDKIHRQGKESLSDDDRRFMDRVSARYRNRS